VRTCSSRRDDPATHAGEGNSLEIAADLQRWIADNT
jgi:hypothetical protein